MCQFLMGYLMYDAAKALENCTFYVCKEPCMLSKAGGLIGPTGTAKEMQRRYLKEAFEIRSEWVTKCK